MTDKITLKTPILSAPMNTVTEHKLAIQLALQGGLGVIHNNSIETQVVEVLKVKRYNNGFIDKPISFSPDTTIETIVKAQKEYGFNSFPILDQNRRLVGSVSKMEVEFRDRHAKAADVMKPYTDLPKIQTKTREDCSLSSKPKRSLKKRSAAGCLWSTTTVGSFL